MMNKQDRRMSEALTRKFIDRYEKLPCLWQLSDPLYSNKYAKKAAYEQLLELVKSEFPSANTEFVVKKINSMRSAIKRERNRVVKNNKHIPVLWYYDLMKFVFTQNDDSPSDNDGCKVENVACIENNGVIIDTAEDIKEMTIESILEENTTYEVPIITEQKETVEIETNEELTEGSEESNREETLDDEFHAIAMCIAAKLRKIDRKNENQRYICEKLINDVLLRGLTKSLTPNTVVSDFVLQYCVK